MNTVQEIIAALAEREAGYVDHPSDRGGPTCWGITEAAARAEGYAGDMRLLPRPMAEKIYRHRYWVDSGFEDVYLAVPGVTGPIGEELLDTGANMGVGTASRFLQRCLNVLNRRGTAWPDLKADGDIGPNTVAAVRSLVAQRGGEGADVLLSMLDSLQSARYIELAEGSETQEDFEYGWQLNRTLRRR